MGRNEDRCVLPRIYCSPGNSREQLIAGQVAVHIVVVVIIIEVVVRVGWKYYPRSRNMYGVRSGNVSVFATETPRCTALSMPSGGMHM